MFKGYNGSKKQWCSEVISCGDTINTFYFTKYNITTYNLYLVHLFSMSFNIECKNVSPLGNLEQQQ